MMNWDPGVFHYCGPSFARQRGTLSLPIVRHVEQSGLENLRKGGMLVFVLALHICCQLKLVSMGLRIGGRDGGIDRH
jgi:hypothetical protein